MGVSGYKGEGTDVHPQVLWGSQGDRSSPVDVIKDIYICIYIYVYIYGKNMPRNSPVLVSGGETIAG